LPPPALSRLGSTHGKGKDKRTGASNEEHDRDVEEECCCGVENEDRRADELEHFLKGSGALEEGDEAEVEAGADLAGMQGD
jgi:hypothetical protein